MSGSFGEIVFKTAFQLSPIVLTGGLAESMPGGLLPIIALTEGIAFVAGLLAGGADVGLDSFFANFQPVAGATVIDNQIGSYPFANQSVAANAIIAQPPVLSMLMICPARGPLGYLVKLATMATLVESLRQHNSKGGTYTVLTPSTFRPNGVMLNMRDVSGGESKQVEAVWQFDFVFPLLTLNQAQQAQNGLMSKLSSGTQVQGEPGWSGLGQTVGDPNSVAGPGILPSATGLSAANTAPLTATNLPPVAGVPTSGYNIVGPLSTPAPVSR